MAPIALLCLALTACTHTQTPTQATTPPSTAAQTSFPVVSQPDKSGFAFAQPGFLSNGEVSLQKAGEARIEYKSSHTENVAWCVTDPQVVSGMQLEGLSCDDDFFKDKALLFVRITTSSGSAMLDLSKAVLVGDDRLEVVYTCQMPQIGTADMCTKLLWAEVDRSLAQYRWSVYGSVEGGQRY